MHNHQKDPLVVILKHRSKSDLGLGEKLVSVSQVDFLGLV